MMNNEYTTKDFSEKSEISGNIDELKCKKCGVKLPPESIYCNMCGTKVEKKETKSIALIQARNEPLIEKIIKTATGTKKIKVICNDITKYDEEIDILTISASANSLEPIPGTLIHALAEKKDIDIKELYEDKYLKIDGQAKCWMSDEVLSSEKNKNIRRVGCVQRCSYKVRQITNESEEESMIKSLKAYYRMLDYLADLNVKMDKVVMPLLGTGSLNMQSDLMVFPLINEAINALKRNTSIREIVFIEQRFSKAKFLAECLDSSYQLMSNGRSKNRKSPYVFISYTTKGDYEIAKSISEVLNSRGISNWFAPNDIKYGEYATKIVEGIEECTHFICLVSKNSMLSPHVLNEVDLAFQHISDGVMILPFKLDDDELTSSFKYYLSRMQWSFGNPPPLFERINEFLDKIPWEVE